MTSIGLINLGVLPLLLAAMTPFDAQHDSREQDSRRSQQEQEGKAKHPQSARPEREEKPQRQKEAKPQESSRPERLDRRDRPRPGTGPDQTTRREAQRLTESRPERRAGPGQPAPAPNRTAPRAQPAPEAQHRSAWPARRARDWKAEHRTWQDRGGYRGYRIPDDRFHGSFGPSHGFRMVRYPLIVIGGFPRFQFSGLWFSVMDPWPEYWSESWYGDDDLYIEYWDDGYYLLNRSYPMDRIAITVLVR